MARIQGLVGTGAGAPFGGGSKKAGSPPLTQPVATAGLSVGLGVAEGLGTVRMYSSDFVASPGDFSDFEIARAAGGPWSTSILYDCTDFYSSPVAVFLKGTTPEDSQVAETTLTISDGSDFCGGG